MKKTEVINISESLSKAWEYRLSQHNDLALELFYSLRHHLLINKDVDVQKYYVKLNCLDSSLKRWSSDLNSSKYIIDKVGSFIEKNGIVDNLFYFYLESSLYFYMQGDIHKALDNMFLAKQFSEDSNHLFLTTLNVIFFMDKLGLFYHNYLEEIKQYLNKLDMVKYRAAWDQYQYFSIKKEISIGNYLPLHSFNVEKDMAYGQTIYFKAYLYELPFIKKENSLSNEQVSKTKSLYLGAFRYRTITFQHYYKDEYIKDSSAIIERCYLWMWKWLGDRETFPVSLLYRSLLNLQNIELCSISFEDKNMLFNVLIWLQKLTGSSLHKLIKKFYFDPTSSNPCSFFLEEERKVLETIDIPCGSGMSESFLTMNSIAREALVYKKSSVINDQKEVVVDEVNSHLYLLKTNEKIISKIFVKTLLYLNNKKWVYCCEFASDVFGLKSYNSFYHKNKISNVLSRLKKHLPNILEYQIKDDKVFITLDSTNIYYIETTKHIRELDDFEIIGKLYEIFDERDQSTQKNIDKSGDSSLVEDILEKWVGRSAIEKGLSTSRSTANRILVKLEKNGHLERKGKSRSTLYFIKKSATHLLEECFR